MKLQISNKTQNLISHLSQEQVDQLVRIAENLKRRSSDRSSTLDEWIVRALKKEERLLTRAEDLQSGIVASVVAKDALVSTPSGLTSVPIGLFSVVVGDDVQIGWIEGAPALVSVAPRRTKLSRPDVHTGTEQLIVANVEKVAIVVSVVSPPLHPRIIDRYLVAIRQGGAKPVLCVNKLDLLFDSDDLEKLEPYKNIDLEIILCSAAENRGIDDLRWALRGSRVAFVGHSGVGKSSLINAYAPQLELKTGDVSHGYGRGTHTTTTSSLHQLADGTLLIDTPGIRSFGLFVQSEEEIAASFPEFLSYSCKFRDCRHVSEPQCGIWEAVRRGEIPEERYWAYRRLIGTDDS